MFVSSGRPGGACVRRSSGLLSVAFLHDATVSQCGCSNNVQWLVRLQTSPKSHERAAEGVGSMLGGLAIVLFWWLYRPDRKSGLEVQLYRCFLVPERVCLWDGWSARMVLRSCAVCLPVLARGSCSNGKLERRRRVP